MGLRPAELAAEKLPASLKSKRLMILSLVEILKEKTCLMKALWRRFRTRLAWIKRRRPMAPLFFRR
ncbi:MAG: hypothetical protein A2Y02_03250 [Omnitrophica bacterium GWA2_52_12]|nr:MAG: hypothetical protein A2Y02_03250 [Omnitrophica bacterium GWA2_52_12]